ncbi:hypothetical protein ACLQ3H_00355 [Micromonospora saelicesensis]|uniref:hypothetical protein n=1 Tax=Micromonospora saelicesensis TaxID=285676 RepID=UPI003CF7E1A8
MIADEVAWAEWRNDPRTKTAQTVLIAARDEAQAQEQFVAADGERRLRLFLDEVDREYRVEHARERGPKALTRAEFREVAAAMLGGTLRRRQFVGWVLDLAPAI